MVPSESGARAARLKAILGDNEPIPDPQQCERLAGGDAVLAAALCAMAAAQHQDARLLRRQAQGLAGARLRDSAFGHFVLTWCLYWTCGLTAVRDELAHRHREDWADLPASWSESVAFLAAQCELLGQNRPDCALQQPMRLPFAEQAELPLPLLEASVNGTRGRFIVDTGAPTTVVSEAFAREVGLRVAWAQSRTVRDGAGRPLPIWPAIAEHVEVGEAWLRHCPLGVLPLAAGFNVAGLLSPAALFTGLAFGFDGPSWCLEVGSDEASPSADAFRAPLLWSDGSATVTARLDRSVDVRLLLDSGAGADILCSELLPRLALPPDGGTGVASLAAGGEVRVAAGPRLRLQVGNGPEEVTAFLSKPCPRDPDAIFPALKDGYLGTPWLRRQRCMVGADRRELVFRPATT